MKLSEVAELQKKAQPRHLGRIGVYNGVNPLPVEINSKSD